MQSITRKKNALFIDMMIMKQLLRDFLYNVITDITHIIYLAGYALGLILDEWMTEWQMKSLKSMN